MKHVALLRGLNVGGNRLPMKDLAAIFVEAGCSDVCTYIQSGNVVFSAPAPILKKLSGAVTTGIKQRFGYQVPVILRTARQLAQTIRDNPFLKDGESEKPLHVYFLADLPGARDQRSRYGKIASGCFSRNWPTGLLTPSQRNGSYEIDQRLL